MEKSADIFHFKKFDVVNERSAMKVNTDGVLLGALMTILPSDRLILDIGTGTGTIALMAAQRLADLGSLGSDSRVSGHGTTLCSCGAGYAEIASATETAIHAIDIDEPSATEAAENFRNSPWDGILHAHHASLNQFAADLPDGNSFSDKTGCGTFDLICSNPPYFDNALQAPEQRRNAARHTSTGLSYREILDFAAERLSHEGRVAMVLPADTEHDLARHARMCGLHLQKITRVRTVPRKSPKLIIAEFGRRRQEHPQDTVLTIQNEGQYTQEYLSLTKEFYLFA